MFLCTTLNSSPLHRLSFAQRSGLQLRLFLGGYLNLTASKSINRFSNTRLEPVSPGHRFLCRAFDYRKTCSYWRMSQLFYHLRKEVISYVGGERSIHISYVSSKLGGHLHFLATRSGAAYRRCTDYFHKHHCTRGVRASSCASLHFAGRRGCSCFICAIYSLSSLLEQNGVACSFLSCPYSDKLGFFG